MDGKEVYLKLKEMNPKVKVLLSSGFSQEGKAQEILDAGANGFIQKPYRIEEIAQKIRMVLEKTDEILVTPG